MFAEAQEALRRFPCRSGHSTTTTIQDASWGFAQGQHTQSYFSSPARQVPLAPARLPHDISAGGHLLHAYETHLVVTH